MTQTIRIAAIQPRLRFGDVDGNLAHVEDLVRSAVSAHSPRLVVLPEGISSPYVGSSAALGTTVRPIDGAPLQLMRMLARTLDIVLAGGFLAHRGGDARSTYAVVEPDGRVHLHDSTRLSPAQRAQCAPGRGRGNATVAALSETPVGIVTGHEWTDRRTVDRHYGRSHLVLGGACWANDSAHPGLWSAASGVRYRQHLAAAPKQLARLLDTPVVLATHVGLAGFGGSRRAADLIAATQIVAHDGAVLAQLTDADGEGHIAADVDVFATPAPELEPSLAARWLRPETAIVDRVAARAVGFGYAASYRARHLLERHAWQSWPSSDLPDEIAAAEAHGQMQSTTFSRKNPPAGAALSSR
ncbi:carbon-nitrogen hydrolase family protein [Nocardia sp. NPDC056611]|uniref:carbon-nitrogen hydrolase family protein n=1 Tax=Nocardia sp. NPDC056611 TaxID=3345877 RepID=UPI003672E8E2